MVAKVLWEERRLLEALRRMGRKGKLGREDQRGRLFTGVADTVALGKAER